MKSNFLFVSLYYFVLTAVHSHIHKMKSPKIDIVENNVIVPPQPVLSTGDKICLDKRIGKLYRALQEWYDDSCHKYQCEIRHGRYTVAVVSCIKPVPPPNATECHEHVSEKKNARYPYCCTRLRCIVTIGRQKYIHVSGQPGEFIPNVLYKDCLEGYQKFEETSAGSTDAEFPEQSAEREPVKFKDDEDDDEPIFEEESERKAMKRSPQTHQEDLMKTNYPAEEHKSILDWVLWPFEVLFLSEAEVLRIVDALDESMYRYWRSVQPESSRI